MVKGLERVFRGIVQLLIVGVAIVVLVLLYSNIQVRFFHKGYANFFGYTFFKVATGSMAPSILEGDVVLVKIGKDFQKDDIVTYFSNDAYITHRVVDVTDGVITLKGDANNANDVPIRKDKVLGKVVQVFSGLQIWKDVFMTPKVLISLFVTLILFDFAFAYQGDQKKSKKKRKRKYNRKKNGLANKVRDKDIEILEVDF